MPEIRLVACAAMFVIASVLDMKEREIPDKVWIGFGGFGLLMTGIELNEGSFNILQYALGIGITAPIGYAIYKGGLYGGADAKALVAVAVLLPFYDMQFQIHSFTALTVLTNATILTSVHIVHNVIRNSIEYFRGNPIFEGFEESTARKMMAFMIGFRSQKAKGYLFCIESNYRGRRKFNFHPGAYEEFVTVGAKNIWVTPALPFIIYMAFGFGAMIFIGDLVALIFSSMIPN